MQAEEVCEYESDFPFKMRNKKIRERERQNHRRESQDACTFDLASAAISGMQAQHATQSRTRS